MYNLKKEKAFTLAETLIICTIFAVMVLGIILGINRAFAFMNNTRLSVMATNFAREGVETVYNIRDSNWRKYSGEKDKNWLNGFYLSHSKYYYFSGTELKGFYPNSYGQCDGTGNLVYDNIDLFFDEIDGSDPCIEQFSKSKVILTGVYSYYSGGSLATGNMNEILEGFGVNFYRVLRVYGVYEKNVNGTTEECSDTTCFTDSDPKELRFCVKVFYEFNGGKHAKELCSIMTNFME